VIGSRSRRGLDLDRFWRGPLDLGAHLLQELDQVVYLGLSGRRLDDGVAIRARVAASIAVLGAHGR